MQPEATIPLIVGNDATATLILPQCSISLVLWVGRSDPHGPEKSGGDRVSGWHRANYFGIRDLPSRTFAVGHVESVAFFVRRRCLGISPSSVRPAPAREDARRTRVRRLILHGARFCVLHLHRETHALGRWFGALDQRTRRNKAVVAPAIMLTRIAWAILTRPGENCLRTKGTA